MALTPIALVGDKLISVEGELYQALLSFLARESSLQVHLKAYGDVTVEHPATAADLAQGIDID